MTSHLMEGLKDMTKEDSSKNDIQKGDYITEINGFVIGEVMDIENISNTTQIRIKRENGEEVVRVAANFRKMNSMEIEVFLTFKEYWDKKIKNKRKSKESIQRLFLFFFCKILPTKNFS